MKNLFTLFIAFFSLVLLNSCREDGSWEDNYERYRFTIDRDNDFTEKGIGEKTQLKYNINPSYKFEVFEMKFKYTSNLNGDLFLDGKLLEQNKEYTLKNQNNIFEYVGKVSGIHKLKLISTNSKKYTKTEEFELKYSVSEFTHIYMGGSGYIYQGDNTNYLMKITPGQGQPTSGYQIKFNSYNGSIKLNGVDVQLGQYYPLIKIDNFTTTLSTNQQGQCTLNYTIKNPTAEKDYTLQQNIIGRKIIIESMNINKNTVTPNFQLSLSGFVLKSPQTTNNVVKYRTWISSASNGDTKGIENTSNIFQPYSLQGGNNFIYNFIANKSGVYTYNIQFQDEYGNLSDIKSFNITVDEALSVIGTPNLFFSIYKADKNSHYVGQVRVSDLNIKSNIENKITKIEVKFKFRSIAIGAWYDKTHSYYINSNVSLLKDHTVRTVYRFKDASVYVARGDWMGEDNVSAEVTIYDDQGRSKVITPHIKGDWYNNYDHAIL